MQKTQGIPVVQLVGPGGAGKTTVGQELAQQLGWQFVDLDREFMSRDAFTDPTVHALSSGFMTCPAEVDASYAAVRAAVERGWPASYANASTIEEEKTDEIPKKKSRARR